MENLCCYCEEKPAEGTVNGDKEVPVCEECYDNYHT